MDADDCETNPSEATRKPSRGKGCLFAVALILLLLVLGAVRISKPRFQSSNVMRVEVKASQFEGAEDYIASTAKHDVCVAVLSAFKEGSLAFPCMCKGYARFQIHYENGAVDHIELLAGHSGSEYYQIRQGLWQYRMSREALARILDGSSLDESRIFAYEAYLYSKPEDPKNNQEAEQDGAGQPATRPESKLEGGDKPQPDAEGRSR